MAFWRPRRRPDDLLRVVQRLEARVSGMERRILQLTERSTHMADNLDALRSGEQTLAQAINDAAARVQASLDALAAKIAAGVNHDELAADVAAIQADVQAVAAIGGPAAAPPAQPAQPAAVPPPAQPQTATTGGPVVPTPAVDTTGQTPTPPAAPDQGQGPVGGQVGT